jgi:hypothetical protein
MSGMHIEVVATSGAERRARRRRMLHDLGNSVSFGRVVGRRG